MGLYEQDGGDTTNIKYIHLDKSHEIKTKPDLFKYEKARNLCGIIKKIRTDYQIKITKSNDRTMRQLGTAVPIIYSYIRVNT